MGNKGRRPRSQSCSPLLTASFSGHSCYLVVAATSTAASASAAVATTSTIAGMPLPACQLPLLVQWPGCQPAQLGRDMQ